MAGKTFKLSIVVDATTAKATKGLGKLGKVVGGLAAGGLALGTAVVGGAALAGGALAKLAISAAPLQGIEDSFEGITKASGKSSTEMLKALKKGSAGMITQRKLMTKYNLAASLVSDTFANELPNAMGYLSRVAAGTGEDMGFMLDSLVRGVGRLSPMILDNLGIQVDLQSAYEAFAPTINKTVGELSKQEQQTALMNQVMEKLAINTANMPEVAGSAAQGLAALQTKFMDLKDTAGQHLLPALSNILTILTKAADKVFPFLESAAENLGKVLEGLTGEFAVALEGGWPAIWALLQEWGKRFWDWLTGPGGAIENTGVNLDKILTAIGDWVTQNWPTIAEHLRTWAIHFWEWLDTDVVPVATEKLDKVSEAVRAWAESEDTQAQFAEFGETVGRGLVEGFGVLGGSAETWTPIMADLAAALMEASLATLPALWTIGQTVATGFIDGFIEKISVSLPERMQGAISSSIVGALSLIPGLNLLLGFPSFQFGGTMPGAKGQPGLAMLHGGETVTPAGGERSVSLTGEAIQLLRAIAAKNGIVVVETGAGEGGRAADHLLSLGDRAWALPSGA